MKSSASDIKKFIDTYGKVKEAYNTVYLLLSTIRDNVRKNKYTLEDMVSLIYVMRELSRLFNDIRKEADGVTHIFENVCCAKYVMTHQDCPEKSDPIRSPLATGTPRVTLGVTLPKERHDPERYYELMRYFGIPVEALKDKLIKGHWPGICERVSQLAEEGKPLPPGIKPDDTYPVYSIIIRAFHELDELITLKGGDESKLLELISTRQHINEL